MIRTKSPRIANVPVHPRACDYFGRNPKVDPVGMAQHRDTYVPFMPNCLG